MPSDASLSPLRGGWVLPRSGRRVPIDSDQRTSLPEFGLVVGQDSKSAGCSAWLWTPSEGKLPSFRRLAAHRWASRVQSSEEAVLIAQRFLDEIVKENGYGG